MTQSEHANLSRRAVLTGVLGAILARPASGRTTSHNHGSGQAAVPLSSTQDSSLAAPLQTPWLAGRPRARVTEFDNDPFVVEIEGRLKCNCGCSHSLYACRTTDFSCGYWQSLHAEVIAMVQQDMSAEEIIDTYVAAHGTQYRMAPPAEGFNLAGYFVPGILITLAGSALAWILTRRADVSLASAEAGGAAVVEGLSEGDEATLAAELEKLES